VLASEVRNRAREAKVARDGVRLAEQARDTGERCLPCSETQT